ncbi:EF-hand domain-containing protein [Nitrospira sp. T9]|uniref:EF-hand domain-containing protein n=1 Tax=unclassified Nitrospira TaxID=2652172 RepID=UPI003F9B2712
MGAEEEELTKKIRRLVKEKFEGNFRKGFDHYDSIDGQDLRIGAFALEQLLTDAKVGNFLTRTLWVEGVLKALDKDQDGAISWDEFASILEDNPQPKEKTAKEPGEDSSPDK